MLYQKLLEIIDKSWIGLVVERKQRIIENTDPDRIYVENVRSFFNLPWQAAKTLCDLAVRQGIFEKNVAFICPNENCKRIIGIVGNGSEKKDSLVCRNCENMEEDNYEFSKSSLKTIEYYKLKECHR